MLPLHLAAPISHQISVWTWNSQCWSLSSSPAGSTCDSMEITSVRTDLHYRMQPHTRRISWRQVIWFGCGFVCPPRLRVLEFNPQCEVLEGLKFNVIMGITGEASGRQLGLQKPSQCSCLVKSRERDQKRQRFTLCFFPCDALPSTGTLSARKLSSNTGHWISTSVS